jgi:hypothetical protein
MFIMVILGIMVIMVIIFDGVNVVIRVKLN